MNCFLVPVVDWEMSKFTVRHVKADSSPQDDRKKQLEMPEARTWKQLEMPEIETEEQYAERRERARLRAEGG